MPRNSVVLPALPAGVDWLTQYGAGILARHIAAYWKARGYAGIVAERYEGVFGVRSNGIVAERYEGVFGVRSNIGPLGWPPRVMRAA